MISDELSFFVRDSYIQPGNNRHKKIMNEFFFTQVHILIYVDPVFTNASVIKKKKIK